MSLGESRSELLSWVNQLLDTDFKRVEQLGTGAAYCQIFDSIYRDVPMARVKFQASYEYEFTSNYKVLQAAFVKHGVTKLVPVEKLLKCKLQDNLEFLQWFKRYWNENKDDSFYDPNTRRKSHATNSSNAGSIVKRSASTTKNTSGGLPSTTRRLGFLSVNSQNTGSSLPTSGSKQPIHHNTITPKSKVFGPSGSQLNNNVTASSGIHTANNNSMNSSYHQSANTDLLLLKSRLDHTENKLSTVSTELSETQQQLHDADAEIQAMTSELTELQIAAEGLETERNFYFNKLRDIEILSQAITEKLSEQADEQYRRQMSGETVTDDVLKNNQGLIDFVEKVQDILYLTEEGFQLPDEDQDEGEREGEGEEGEGNQYYRESIKGNDILQDLSIVHGEEDKTEQRQEDILRSEKDQIMENEEEECF